MTIRPGGRACLNVIDAHRDRFSGICRSPNWNRHPSLYNGSVAEKGARMDISRCHLESKDGKQCPQAE